MRRIRIYISGPLTNGDRLGNFHTACSLQRQLLEARHAPLNPHLSMQHPAAWQIDYEHWIEADLAWVEVADCLFRFPGESSGADREVEHAEKHSIPVFKMWADLDQWLRKQTASAASA